MVWPDAPDGPHGRAAIGRVAKLQGLVSRPELNDTVCEVLAWDEVDTDIALHCGAHHT